MVWCGLVWFGVHDMVWYGVVCVMGCGVVWLVWCGVVCRARVRVFGVVCKVIVFGVVLCVLWCVGIMV